MPLQRTDRTFIVPAEYQSTDTEQCQKVKLGRVRKMTSPTIPDATAESVIDRRSFRPECAALCLPRGNSRPQTHHAQFPCSLQDGLTRHSTYAASTGEPPPPLPPLFRIISTIKGIFAIQLPRPPRVVPSLRTVHLDDFFSILSQIPHHKRFDAHLSQRHY